MSLPDLAAVLWRQREMLERLIYRLECEQLILASGRSRWLSVATTEIETVLDELAVIELQRAQIADRVALSLRIEPGASLEDLAAGSQPPWTGVLHEHRNALLVLTAELATLAEANKSLLSAGVRAVESALDRIGLNGGGDGGGYNAKGRPHALTPVGQAVVDWAL